MPLRSAAAHRGNVQYLTYSRAHARTKDNISKAQEFWLSVIVLE